MEEAYCSPVLDGELIGIKFGLATHQEICTASMMGCSISHTSQLSNPFLGLPLEFGKCESCGASEPGKCEGHFGYIDLPSPIYHPNHVSELKKLLSCLCLKCLKIKKNKVMQILKRIPEDTKKKLSAKGYNPQDRYILNHIPVPPNCLSGPEISDGVTVISACLEKDPSISMLKKVLKEVDNITRSRSGPANFVTEIEEANRLQAAVDQYLQVRGTGKVTRESDFSFGGTKDLSESSTKQWLEKMMTLFIRKGSGFSSRTVIAGDAYRRVNEVGIPYEIAQRITFEENVNVHNIRRLQELGNKLCLTYMDGSSTYSLRDGSKGHTFLRPGQVVHRRIMDGDLVFVNRPPTIHKHSLQTLQVYVHEDKEVKINTLICGPLSADFDGDCIHLFYPQSLAAKAEVMELLSVLKQLLSSHSGKPNLQLATDSLLSLKMMFKKYFFDKEAMQQLAMFVSSSLPEPAFLRANSVVPCWTALQIMQAALPPHFECSCDRHLVKDSVVLKLDCTTSLVPAVINDIGTSIFFKKSAEDVLNFFNSMQPLLVKNIFSEGFSVGLEDFAIRDIQKGLKDISPFLYHMRRVYNELVEMQLGNHIRKVKGPVGSSPQNLFPAGEPVGVLAATAMSHPAYKAVFDCTPSSNSSWDLMKEILLCKVSFKNELIDCRVVLYLNDWLRKKYCREYAAYLAKNQLKKVSLKDATLEFMIENINSSTKVKAELPDYEIVSWHATTVLCLQLEDELIVGVDSFAKSIHKDRNPLTMLPDYEGIASEVEQKFVQITKGVYAALCGDGNRCHEMVVYLRKEILKFMVKREKPTSESVSEVATRFFHRVSPWTSETPIPCTVLIFFWTEEKVGDEFAVPRVRNEVFGSGSGSEFAMAELLLPSTPKNVTSVKKGLVKSALEDPDSGGVLRVFSLKDGTSNYEYEGLMMDELDDPVFANQVFQEYSMFLIIKEDHEYVLNRATFSKYLDARFGVIAKIHWLCVLDNILLVYKIILPSLSACQNWFNACLPFRVHTDHLRYHSFTFRNEKFPFSLCYARSGILQQARNMTLFDGLFDVERNEWIINQ